MKNEAVVVIDCGSTNITVSAIDSVGNFLGSAAVPNSPSKQPGGDPAWFIWDIDAIWARICKASRELAASVDLSGIKAATVTTFGADGAFAGKDGKPVYPVISWQCTRTEETAKEILDVMNPREIYDITGYNIIRFNTLLRFMWLRKHAPEVFTKADKWMMAPGLISHRLTGEMSIDSTSASTMMSLDLKNRRWSEKMLGLAGMDTSFFPRWVEPGEIIGKITPQASVETGLPSGIPVTAAGHDTQFALVGSGAKEKEAVLSSGTWEILLVRTKAFMPNDAGYENGLISECDAHHGMFNPQLLMMGSGMLEWVRKNFYALDDTKKEIYEIMISEAEKVSPSANDLFITPTFVPGTGPFQKYGIPGGIHGISVTTTRAEVYRAALESLSFQLRTALEVVEKSTGFKPEAVRVVGGGAKNKLWNKIRADVTGLPVILTNQKEITALGAAFFAFTGAGIYKSTEEARSNVDFSEEKVLPSENRGIYEEKYAKFMRIPQALQGAYK